MNAKSTFKSRSPFLIGRNPVALRMNSPIAITRQKIFNFANIKTTMPQLRKNQFRNLKAVRKPSSKFRARVFSPPQNNTILNIVHETKRNASKHRVTHNRKNFKTIKQKRLKSPKPETFSNLNLRKIKPKHASPENNRIDLFTVQIDSASLFPKTVRFLYFCVNIAIESKIAPSVAQRSQL